MKKCVPTAARSIPREILDLLGPPPILSTEDAELYYASLARFAKDIAPTDIITWLLIKDLVDYRIEIARCRRFKGAIIKQAYDNRINLAIKQRHATLDAELKALRAKADADYLVELRKPPHDSTRLETVKTGIEAQFEKDAGAKRDLYDKTIQSWNALLPQESDIVATFSDWIGDHDRVERLLENAEQKFFNVLRQIERHVSGFGKALREELMVIEGEVLQRIEAKPAPT